MGKPRTARRRSRGGIGAKHGKLYLGFTFRGVRCKEHTGEPDTPENRERFTRLLGIIRAQIKADQFDYRKWFPEGRKLVVFYGSPAIGSASISFDDWATRWYQRRSPFRSDGTQIADAEIHPTTWWHEHSIIEKWLRPRFARRRLQDVSAAECRDLKRSILEKGRKGKTALNILGVLHKMLADAVEEELISSNPVPKLQWRRDTRGLRSQSRPLSAEEVRAFLRDLPWRVDLADETHVTGEMLRDLYMFWFRTGWRPSEVMGLRFDHCSPTRQVLEVRVGRSPRNGGVEAAPKEGVREVLADYEPMIWTIIERRRQQALATGHREYVFTDSVGRPLSQEWLGRRIWNPTIRRIGLSARGQYNIRDTFISLALSAGEDPGWVAQVCGTSEQMIFQHYRHWMPSLRRGHGQRMVAALDLGPEIGPETANGPEIVSDSELLEEWTRSQSIRTAALIPFSVALLETSPPPAYQRIAPDAQRMSRLGLSAIRIAAVLSVSDKTVTKALRWSSRAP